MNRAFTALLASLLFLGCLQPGPAPSPTATPLATPSAPITILTPTPAIPTLSPAPTPAPTATPLPSPTPTPGPAAGTLEGLAGNVQAAVAKALNRTISLEETTEAYGGYTQRIFIAGLKDTNYDLSIRVLRPATRWGSTDLYFVQRRKGETLEKAEVYWEQASTFDKQTNKIRMPCYGWRLFVEANLDVFLPPGTDPQSSARLVRALIDACPD